MRTVTVTDCTGEVDDYPHESVQYATDDTGECQVFALIAGSQVQFATYAEGKWVKARLHEVASG